MVGSDTADDAAVWRRPDGPALVATADFFTPIVDDAHTWGRIAAANAASDVYAMGGRPLFALNLVAWPRDRLPLDLLGDVLEGGASMAAEGGWVVAGGHTIDGHEPLYGQAVIGEVDPDRVLTNAGGRPGDALVLTKPLGTGLVATAVKRSEPGDVEPGGRWHAAYTEAVAEMTRLNAVAAEVALEAGASACTDVTGFGLLGHVGEIAAGSGVGARLDAEAVPLLAQARDLVADGAVPGGTRRNLDHVRPRLVTTRDDAILTLLADAQTSGGLVFACAASAAEDAVAALTAAGHRAAVVGALVDGDPGGLEVV